MSIEYNDSCNAFSPEPRTFRESELSNQKSFCEFLCYFHVCKKQSSLCLSSAEYIRGINEIRYSIKQKCICQSICSNKHSHLLQEIIKSPNSHNQFSRLVNENIDLNIADNHDQGPLLGALRQGSSEYAKILLQQKSNSPLDLNRFSLKHGYPLHIAILTHKFDIALELLKRSYSNKHFE